MASEMKVAHGALAALLARLPAGSRPVLLFTGSEDAGSGKSWCPDCVAAKAPVAAALARHKTELAGVVLVHVDVGPRAEWKSPQHPARGAPYRVTGVPTMLVPATPARRLVEEQLTSASALDLFFEEL